MDFLLQFPPFWPSAFGLFYGPKLGILAEKPRDILFADSEYPSSSAKETQLQAQMDSRKVPG